MRLFAIILLSLIVAGCNGRVEVVDAAGKPLEGAHVSPVTLSMGGAPILTNERGEASAPLRVSVQDTKWVKISKQGYQWRQVKVPATWPLKVVLKRAKPHA